MGVLTNPERLGKYTIQSLLGEGGMGVVYKGFDEGLKRDVAIKTIRPALLKGQTGRELRERFQREAQAAGRLRHANIVAIYEYQEDQAGNPFFVMEFIDGRSLKEFLARGMHFNLGLSVHIISQVLSALAHSHREGIIHRDIKPANILLMEDDSVKIADFGIARMEESDLTVTGGVIGSPLYFSPEQRAGDTTDARSDLYSTALVFFELLTGEKRFTNPTDAANNRRFTDEQLAVLDTQPLEIQRLTKALLTRALAVKPDGRFQTAAAFLDALKPLTAKSTTATKVTRKWWWLGAAITFALVAGAIIFWRPELAELFSTSGTKPPVTPYRELSQLEQERVDRYLKIADIHQRVGRLILPDGSNAYDAYSMVKEIDPENSKARAGLALLQQKVLAQLQQLAANGQLESAQSQLSYARTLFPRNLELLALESEIDQAD